MIKKSSLVLILLLITSVSGSMKNEPRDLTKINDFATGYFSWPDGLFLRVDISGPDYDVFAGYHDYEILIEILDIGEEVVSLYDMTVYLNFEGLSIEAYSWPVSEIFEQGDIFGTNLTLYFPADKIYNLIFGFDFRGDVPFLLDNYYEKYDVALGIIYPDVTPPQIVNIHDTIQIEEAEMGELEWRVNEVNPDYYEVKLGQSILENGTYEDSVPIYFWFDGFDLGLGEHLIEFYAYDLAGYNESSSSLVKVNDGVHPSISNLPDLSYEYNTTGHNLIWDVSDNHPGFYTITINGAMVVPKEPWVLPNITFNVDGLEAGVHDITIIINDTSGNSATDTVIVRVDAVIIKEFYQISISLFLFTLMVIVSVTRKRIKEELN